MTVISCRWSLVVCATDDCRRRTMISTHPTTEQLRGLLHGNASELQQAELTEHLSDCSGCQKQLEDLAAGGERWADAARGIAHDTPPPTSAFWPALKDLG